MTPHTPRAIKAQDVGRYFVYLANKDKKPISNKKLQKLVYYAQAWSLVLNGRRLFSEPVEAWVHGPAVRNVYGEYKRFSFNPISLEVSDANVRPIVGKTKALLDDVWRVYGKFDAQYLEMLTHSEKPWREAREGLQSYENSEREITPQSMKSYFSEKLARVSKKR